MRASLKMSLWMLRMASTRRDESHGHRSNILNAFLSIKLRCSKCRRASGLCLSYPPGSHLKVSYKGWYILMSN